ncbi:MAG: WG repeat-containing protein [Clostridia bacterium]|nr:WG repeat-containing protein [Clostridia bacterium]
MKRILFSLFAFQCLLFVAAAAATAYEYAIEPIYSYAGDFNVHGLAHVVDESGAQGVIDVNGNKIFGFDGTQFRLRKNGLIMAAGENDMAAFFDKTGVQLTDYIYDTYITVNPKTPHEVRYRYLTDLYDGDGKSDLVPISRGKKFGYINSAGIEVIPPIYEYVYGFYNGVSRTGAEGILSEYGTYTNGKFGYINESGEELYPANSLWSAQNFRSDFAEIADGQFKVIDTSGAEIDLPIGEYRLYDVEDGLILAHNGEQQTIVFDYSGNVVVPCDWRRKTLFCGSVIIESEQIVTPNGRVLYEAPEGAIIRYSSYDGSEFGYISKNITDTETVSGLINSRGEIVFPCEYNNITDIGEDLIYAENHNGKNIIYNERGRELCVLNGQVRGRPCMEFLPVLDFDTMKFGYIKSPVKTKGERSAEFLYKLGLFKGVSVEADKPQFALDRGATRAEALVMLLRAIGRDAEAQSSPKTHPFTDVPAWADGYVSYAYNNGITKGVSDGQFGTGDVSDAEYITFMLRALGYSDGEDGYEWDNPYNFAREKGIWHESYGGLCLRSDMADITYNTLYAAVKDGGIPLWQQLENEGVIEKGAVPEEKKPTKTYEEALEEAAPDEDYVIVYPPIEAPACSVVQTCITGTPHGAYYRLKLVFKSGSQPGEGTIIGLPLPPVNGWYVPAAPDEIYLFDDGDTLYYSVYFASDAGYMLDEYVPLHERGNYEYTVDLKSGEVTININKDYVKENISGGDAAALCYDYFGTEGYSFAYLHTTLENGGKYHVIQKRDFSQTVQNERTMLKVFAKTGEITQLN